MSEQNETQALDQLSHAIARLEDAFSSRPPRAAAVNDGAAEKHAKLQADVTEIIRDLDTIIEGHRHG